MNPNDFIQLLNSEHSIKELTNAFNSVSVDGRKWILNNLAENERKSLISIISLNYSRRLRFKYKCL